MKQLRVHHIHHVAEVAILLLQDLSPLCVTDIDIGQTLLRIKHKIGW